MSDSTPGVGIGRAIRGAIGFLTRIPVGGSGADWNAFQRAAYSLPVVGYLIVGLVVRVFFIPVQPPNLVTDYVLYLIQLSTPQ